MPMRDQLVDHDERARSTRALAWCSVAVLTALSAGWIAGFAEAAGGLALAQPRDPYIGTVAIKADAATNGMYGKVVSWPLVAIHASVAQTGELVTYGTPLGAKKQAGLVFDHWNPATNKHVQSPTLAVDSFCNIAVPATSGRLMMAGGNSQTTSGTYDTAARSYSALPNFAFPRWYASMIRLPDERYVVMGGAEPKAKEGEAESRFASTPEILTPGAPNWKPLTGAKSVPLFGSPDYAWWYPKAYLAPSGKVFGVSQARMWTLDPDANGGNGSIVDHGKVPGTGFGSSASSVMFEPGKILLAGGGQENNYDLRAGSRDAAVIDISGSTPVATSVSAMAKPRNWANLTVLPNGEVLATGGTEVGVEGTPVRANEIWNPGTRTWRTLAAGVKTRTYHSTAVLLPSGAVFVGGGGVPGPVNNLNAEFFLPPQLFTKVNGQTRWADRPEFRDVYGRIARGGSATFGMKDNRAISSVSLTTAGSVTHSYSADQRRVPLAFSQAGSSVTVQFPSGATTLPAGLYLLNAVDASGVPAPSQLVEIMPDGSRGSITVFGSGPQVPPLSASGSTTTTTVPTTVTTTTVPAAGGRVGWWRLDENAGTVASDSSGNANTGTLLNGVGWAAGRIGRATDHTGGANQHVRVAGSSSLDGIAGRMTVAAWIAPTTPTSPYNQGVVTRQYATGANDQWYLGLRGGLPTFSVNTSVGGTKRVSASLKAAADRWTHVAGTFDGSTLRIYVDGVEVGSVAKSGTIRASTARPVVIGGNQNNGAADAAQELFRGLIDEVVVYDTVLGPSQIAVLAAGTPVG